MLKVIVVKTKNVWSYHLATLQIENIIAGREKQKDVPMIAKNNYNVLRLAEVPHSRNFGFEQELSCGILANRCYAYVPTCLAGISFGTRIEIFN